MDRYARVGLTALRLAGLMMIAGTVAIWIGAGMFDGCDPGVADCGDRNRSDFVVLLGTSPLGVIGALAVAWSLWWEVGTGGRRLAGPWRLFAWLLRPALWLCGALTGFVALAAPDEAGPLAIVVSPFCAAIAFGSFWAARRITRTLKAPPEP